MNTCKLCGYKTESVFNIRLKAVHICEDCARSIFIQQAKWYAIDQDKELKNIKNNIENLINNQQDIPKEISEIVNSNFWELI